MSERKYDLSNSTFHGCVIGDNAQVIHSVPAPTQAEYQEMMTLLKELKQAVNINSVDYRGLEAIEDSAQKKNWGILFSAVKTFGEQFTSATLANLTSGYLGHLLGIL